MYSPPENIRRSIILIFGIFGQHVRPILVMIDPSQVSNRIGIVEFLDPFQIKMGLESSNSNQLYC